MVTTWHAFTDPQKMVAALIYMLIIQQVDGNIFLYPRIVGVDCDEGSSY